jgi:ribosomal protein L7/L12
MKIGQVRNLIKRALPSFARTIDRAKTVRELEFIIDIIVGAPAQTFDLILTDAGANKIGAIKAVREITSLGLKEAKDVVDASAVSPVRVATGMSFDVARKGAGLLAAAGAVTEIKERVA